MVEAGSQISRMWHQTFITTQGEPYTYTISIGYAEYPTQAKTVSELARNVDSALYNVKLNGKHGCQRYVNGMAKQSRRQLGFSQKELLDSLPGPGFICHAENTEENESITCRFRIITKTGQVGPSEVIL